MRVPLLLLLLLGLSSADTTSATPGGSTQAVASTTTSMVQGNPTSNNAANSQPTSMMLSASAQATPTTSKMGNPLSTPSSMTPAITRGTIPTNKPPSTSTKALVTTPGTTLTTSLGSAPPAPMTSAHPSKQFTSSAGSGASTAAPTPTTSATQQKISTPANSGSPAATAAANSVLTPVSSPPTTSRDVKTTATFSTSVATQRSQLTVGTTVTPNSKDLGRVSSSASPTSSPTHGPAFSTRPGSTDSSVSTPHGSALLTTSKAPLSSTPDSTIKVSRTATTSSPGTDHGKPDITTTKPVSTGQSPASTSSPVPAAGDQTTSSTPDQQYSDHRFRNEVNCTVQEQNFLPTVYLKEAKTCDEWEKAGANVSFYEIFCSTGQRAFNASRETCTVTMISSQSPSQHWAVRVIVHLPLDPEKVLEQMNEKKDKLEELGIFNVTYGTMEREMVINDEFSTPLIITIVTLAGSLLLIAAIYGCCHQRFSQKKDQHIHPDLPGFDDGHVALIFNQRLTEELQTMENGYHDNPTLEVMETSSEMQEKKVNLNGELGDSWIVPLDTLMKEDLEEEEDTHL